MKFLGRKGYYINPLYIKEMYVLTDKEDDNTKYYQISIVMNNDEKRYLESYENRDDAARALENLVRSLED